MVSSHALIGGPYKSPRCKVGSRLYDILRGDLIVCGISDAPMPWPLGRSHPVCRPLPIVTVELVRAIREESELAVMYHWGVSRVACPAGVGRWRSPGSTPARCGSGRRCPRPSSRPRPARGDTS